MWHFCASEPFFATFSPIYHDTHSWDYETRPRVLDTTCGPVYILAVQAGCTGVEGPIAPSIQGEEATETCTRQGNMTGCAKYSSHGLVVQLLLTIGSLCRDSIHKDRGGYFGHCSEACTFWMQGVEISASLWLLLYRTSLNSWRVYFWYGSWSTGLTALHVGTAGSASERWISDWLVLPQYGSSSSRWCWGGWLWWWLWWLWWPTVPGSVWSCWCGRLRNVLPTCPHCANKAQTHSITYWRKKQLIQLVCNI